jgi:prevent-host-death family protein
VLLEVSMRHPNLSQDIQPLSEFRANAAAMLARVKSTKRPLVLTQRGHSAAVVVDVAEYERMREELELLQDIATADRQIAEGLAIPHEEAMCRVRKRLGE